MGLRWDMQCLQQEQQGAKSSHHPGLPAHNYIRVLLEGSFQLSSPLTEQTQSHSIL